MSWFTILCPDDKRWLQETLDLLGLIEANRRMSNFNRSVRLSVSAFERASEIDEKNFVIVVDSEEIRCTRFQATFIYPHIADLLRIDPTTGWFHFQDDVKGSSNLLKLLQELLTFGRINFRLSQMK
jgi:hypothetical protein